MIIEMAGEVMTVEQLAQYLNVSVTTIYKLTNEGKIPGTKVGNQWRFRKEKIDEWLDQGGKVSLGKKK